MGAVIEGARAHRWVGLILLVHAAVFWSVVGTASPWTTAPLECATGAMADVVLGSSSWSVWDSFHGALAGMLLAALAGLPLYATLGAGGLVMKLTAWGIAVVLLLLIYALVDRHESRPAALVATAGLAFCPPALFHAVTVLGNWHWTQLLFDYGLLLFALELARRERGPLAWGLFGLASGFGIFNSLGSLPFIAVAWGLLLAARWGREVAPRLLAAVGGGLLGLLPFLYKLLLHRPFGIERTPDQTVQRLTRLRFEPERLTDLVGPELSRALHVRDAIDWLPTGVVGRVELLWAGVVWLGLAAAAVMALRGWRRSESRRLLPLPLAVAAFAALFALAYVLLGTHLEGLPHVFANAREPAHRALPPLLAALLVGSAMGWTRMAKRWPEVRVPLLALALAPAAIGLVSQLSLVQPGAPGGLSSYRGACGDALGFNAAASFKGDAAGALASCEGLSDPATDGDCRTGAAWGAGYHGGRVGSLPKEHAPTGWDTSQLALTVDSREVCDGLPEEERGSCLFGLGWFVGVLSWGRQEWPLDACNSLPRPADRPACWRGVGFPVGDHLHPSPWKVGAALGRVPREHRAEVAWGAGVAIGRTWSSRPYADWLCEQAGAEVEACKAGVASRH